MRCEEARVSRRWASWEEDLLRERGLFGPGPGVLVSRGWVLDGSEGPGRTRPRIRRKALRRSKKVSHRHGEVGGRVAGDGGPS